MGDPHKLVDGVEAVVKGGALGFLGMGGGYTGDGCGIEIMNTGNLH